MSKLVQAHQTRLLIGRTIKDLAKKWRDLRATRIRSPKTNQRNMMILVIVWITTDL
jgi:hypothetical protein